MANEQSVATFFSQVMAAVGANTAGPGTVDCHWITFARQILPLIHVIDVTAGCKIILAIGTSVLEQAVFGGGNKIRTIILLVSVLHPCIGIVEFKC
jgi:hypothetical protein